MTISPLLTSIRTRVTLGEAVLAIGLAIVGFVATSSIGTTGDTAVVGAERTAFTAEAVGDLAGAVSGLDRVAAMVVARGGFGSEQELTAARTGVRSGGLALWRSAGDDRDSRRTLQRLVWVADAAEARYEYAVELARLGRDSDAGSAVDDARSMLAQTSRLGLEYQADVARQVLDLTSSSVRGSSGAAIVSWLVVALMLVAGTALVGSGIGALGPPLATLSTYCGRLARGDLRPMKLGDFPRELGDAADGIKRVGVQLRTMVSRSSELSEAAADLGAVVIERSHGLRKRAFELHDGLSRLSRRSSDQENRAAQGNAQTDRLTAAVGEFNDSMDVLRERSESMKRAVTRNRAAIGEAVAVVRKLAAIIQTGSEQTQTLRSLAGTVDEIDGVVARMASQSEVLALNSAIEAARGGMMGPEMKVVAGEVGAMADASTAAAAQSAELAGRLRDQIAIVVSTLEEGRNRVRGAESVAEEAEESLDEISKDSGMLETGSESAFNNARLLVGGAQDIRNQMQEIARESVDHASLAHDSREQAREQGSDLDAVIASLAELGRSTDQLRNLLQSFRL